jgi:hypothetical protein
MTSISLRSIIAALLTTLFTTLPATAFSQSQKALTDLKNAKIILTGEMHFFTPTETYDYLFDQFSSGSNSNLCLALEYPETTSSFEEVLSDLKIKADLIRVDSHPLAPKISKNFDMNVSYYGKIKDLAKKYSLKIVMVEHFNKYNLELSVDQRNVHMSENIAKLFNQETCSRILGIFGKVHLSMGMMRETTIQNLLLKLGMRSVTINLQMTNENGIDPAMKAFTVSQLEAPREEFIIIENNKLKQDVKMLPGIADESSTWQNFEYTLLIPTIFSPIVYPD